MASDSVEPTVARVGGISYVRIPAPDAKAAGAFYGAVFGWNIRGDPELPHFDDGTGHVIGEFAPDQPVAGEAGIRPYVFVEDVRATLDRVVAAGGEVREPPYPEGDLTVATFRDPAGNVVGVWQQA